jgi:hypothetical protein
MALTRTRNIRVPEQALDAERAHGILDPAGILPDWTADERAALLRQALFDPATYGRVRFHHRSIQEYLAARRLFTLKQRGMTMAALYRLLFARQYGVDVVLPSMAPMAAWLALWIPEVMKSLLMREPETLLEHGDPESLTTESRIKTLRAFATMYGTGQWRGLNIPIDEVRRLAHPDLDPTLRELWETSSGNSDVRELLLELIWKGASRECVDLALVAALEQSFDPYHRLLGIWALATVGCTTELAVIARHMVSNPGHWPTGLAARATPSLFPAVLSVFDLLTIAQRAPDGKRPNDGIGLPLKEICGDILATDPLAIERRQGLVALILSGRHDEEPYDITGSFDHLVPALATLCARQLRTSGAVDPALIHASAVAGRFGHREAEEEIGTLRSAIAAIPALRESIFWAELALADYLLPESNTLVRLFRVQEATLLTGWLPSDLPWLLKAAGDQTHPERREAALEIVIRIPDAAHIGPSKLDALRRAVVDDEVLSAHLTTALNPGPAKHWAELEATHRQRVAGERFEEEISLLHWDAWRQEVRADPLRAFAPAFIGANADQILFWLRRARSWANRRWQDEEMLAAAFGPDVARLFLTELKRRWRQLAVPTGQSDMLGWSNSQIQAALISVEVEAKEAGWASRLSQSEATIATAVALNMVNGFADWLTELTEW